MTIGIVTCSNYPLLTDPEKPLLDLFAARAIQAKPVVWSDPSVDWRAFDCLLLRSMWDYHLHVNEFFHWLDNLKQANVRTLNSLPTVYWNRNKFYLERLQQQGVKIIPTEFIHKTNDFSLASIKELHWKQVVIKPAISANSFLTESFSLQDASEVENRFKMLARERDFLVQEFMPEVQQSGEISLIFFDKVYSHAVVKIPASGDFRVQKEHGGKTLPFNPPASIIETAADILKLINEDLLYARVDGIIRHQEFVLMELELLEPELFFHFKEGAREAFVEATCRLL